MTRRHPRRRPRIQDIRIDGTQEAGRALRDPGHGTAPQHAARVHDHRLALLARFFAGARSLSKPGGLGRHWSKEGTTP